MPRINFHLQLAELKDKLLAMAALSQQALEFSVEGYLERDMALCNHVLEIEEAINTGEPWSTRWRTSGWPRSSPWPSTCASSSR